VRTFSDNVEATIAEESFRYFVLIKVALASGEYYYTSHHSDIDWDGKNWLSDGGIFSYDSPSFSSVVDREAYKIVLADISNEFYDEFRAGVVGRDISVYVGLCDPITRQPMVATDGSGVSDVLFMYKGKIDSPSVEINWDSKTAVIEGTSPMADLDQINVTMVSKDGMDQLSLTDTSYDRIYEGSEVQLGWGKI